MERFVNIFESFRIQKIYYNQNTLKNDKNTFDYHTLLID